MGLNNMYFNDIHRTEMPQILSSRQVLVLKPLNLQVLLFGDMDG